MKYTTVIFDMDGTVLNSLEDLADSVNYALQQCSYPTRSITEIQSFVGNGIEKLIERAVPSGTSTSDILHCLDLFKTHYQKNKTNKTKPYPGIVELLTKLKEKNIKTAIVSNKFKPAAVALSNYYFPGLIDETIGASEQLKKKPDPSMVYEALTLLHTTKEECLYVGDSGTDMDTAKNAGLTSVGVAWGFRSVELLQEHGANHIIHSASELLELL